MIYVVRDSAFKVQEHPIVNKDYVDTGRCMNDSDWNMMGGWYIKQWMMS